MHPQKHLMERYAKNYMDIYNNQCNGKQLFNFLKTQRKYYTDYIKKTEASGAAAVDRSKLSLLQQKCLEIFSAEESTKPTVSRNRGIQKSATVSME